MKVEKLKNCMVVKIHTEKLDSVVAPELKAQLVSISSEGAKNIIIDISSARYCDSSGLSAILVGNRLCKNAGGKLVVSGVRDPVKKLILISQLDSILNTSLTVEEGVKFLTEAEAAQ